MNPFKTNWKCDKCDYISWSNVELLAREDIWRHKMSKHGIKNKQSMSKSFDLSAYGGHNTKDIPINEAKKIANKYGYHQIVIIGRAIGEGGREHCTTYGVDKANCDVAARIGDFLKYKVMNWVENTNNQ